MFGDALVWGDFNGDGYDDLAIGSAREDVGGVFDAGAVNVIYGGVSGLSATGNQYWSQDSPGILDQCESADRYGDALAVGDFNGDGFDDLVVGIQLEGVGTVEHAGAVNVLYGSMGGLDAATDQLWDQNSTGVLDSAEKDDLFGKALAVGDFNGDGFDDLAIGVPGETIGPQEAAGAVNVLYGTAAGLAATGNQFWHQNSAGIEERSESQDLFGDSLAAGDFDGDGFADLAIGVPGESVGNLVEAGAVNVLYGTSKGLSATNGQLWHQNSNEVFGVAERQDFFGSVLTVGDFDNDGYSDLVVGVPKEDVGSVVNAGAVNVLYGAVGGLGAIGNQSWHQSTGVVLGDDEQNAYYGSSLSAGDFDGDGYDDLAVGIPQATVSDITEAGAVGILFGGKVVGLTDTDNQLWNQGTSNAVENAESYDHFGHALAAGDFDGDGVNELAIGVVHEDLGDISTAGAVNILFGEPNAMALPTAQTSFSYSSVPIPQRSSLLSANQPIATGHLNTGLLSPRVRLPMLQGAADLYLSYSSDTIDMGKEFQIVDDNDHPIKPLSDGAEPWKTQSLGGFNDAVLGDIQTSTLPPGNYNANLKIVPTGQTDDSAYYRWTTSFTLP